MGKENLAIVSNEKTYINNQNYFCDNIDMKSIPEGLNKNYDIELFVRNSKSERSSHKIDLKNIIVSKNIQVNKKYITASSEKIKENDLVEVNIPEEKTNDKKQY